MSEQHGEAIFDIIVSDARLSQANKNSDELVTALRKAAPGIQTKRKATSTETLDLGTIISVIVDAGSIALVAQGIANWLSRRPKATISLKGRDFSLEAKNLDTRDVVKMTETITAVLETKK